MTCVVVLGTHRTGTSTVSGMLHHLGVNMGDNMKGPHPSNPKGHFEDMDFLLLNDRMVGDWRNPSVEHISAHIHEYEKLVMDRSSNNLWWGIKDPRLCVTLPYFAHLLGDFQIIATDRSIESSATSLRSVHPMAHEEAVRIQKLYLGHRAKFLKDFNGPLLHVEYEKLVEDPATYATLFNMFLGRHQDTSDAIAFVDAKLKHY